MGRDNSNMTRPCVLSEKKLNTQALNTEIIKQQTKWRNCIPQVVKWKRKMCLNAYEGKCNRVRERQRETGWLACFLARSATDPPRSLLLRRATWVSSSCILPSFLFDQCRVQTGSFLLYLPVEDAVWLPIQHRHSTVWMFLFYMVKTEQLSSSGAAAGEIRSRSE